METGVYLTQSTLAALSESARAEISKALFPVSADEAEWDADVVRLTAAEGYDFVLGCSAKSRALLQVIVDHDGDISHREIQNMFGATAADLKSVFGGLTKRARTVSGNKKAKLIQWELAGGEWVANVHPTTVDALRPALREAA